MEEYLVYSVLIRDSNIKKKGFLRLLDSRALNRIKSKIRLLMGERVGTARSKAHRKLIWEKKDDFHVANRMTILLQDYHQMCIKREVKSHITHTCQL